MRILEKLWYGNIKPSERKLPLNSTQSKLVNLIARHEEALIPMLSEETKKVYEKLRECQSELSSLNECDAFVSGFQLASKIMLEAMKEDVNE